jgi:hypothetical protein
VLLAMRQVIDGERAELKSYVAQDGFIVVDIPWE